MMTPSELIAACNAQLYWLSSDDRLQPQNPYDQIDEVKKRLRPLVGQAVRLFESEPPVTAKEVEELTLPRDSAVSNAIGLVKRLRSWIIAQQTPQPMTQDGGSTNAEPISDAPVHSADFSSVRIGEAHYSFSPIQRRMVAALWTEWEKGTIWLGHAAIQEAADTDSRIVDVFKGHEALNKLIVKHKDKKDLFGLAIPVPPK